MLFQQALFPFFLVVPVCEVASHSRYNRCNSAHIFLQTPSSARMDVLLTVSSAVMAEETAVMAQMRLIVVSKANSLILLGDWQ